MDYKVINFNQKYSLFNDRWSPKVIAEMNDYQFKLVKVKGEFEWHSHEDTDETFIVIEGVLQIKFRDGIVNLKQGEMFVVPKGVEHKPVAQNEVKILIVEPRGVLNTGNLENNELTAKNNVWI